MGSFSWLFADTNNTKNLRANRRGYVACPDGTFICEPCYETYGIFDGKDVYDLVVDWNREFIAENPDHLLPHVHCWTKYPIKITSKKTGICYEELPPSKWDPEQGLCEYRSQRYQ